MSGSDSGKLPFVLTSNVQTSVLGVALTNATNLLNGIITPGTGGLHIYMIACAIVVTSLETGGAVAIQWTIGGNAQSIVVSAGSAAAGTYPGSAVVVCDPSTQVGVFQTSALTAGAAKCYASMLGA